VITYKDSEKPKINNGNIGIVADALAGFSEPFVLVHGAGSFGHPIVKRTGINKGISDSGQLLAFAETQILQNKLNYLFCDALVKKGIPAFPAQLSSYAILEKGRLLPMKVDAITGLLQLGMVPVCYGVPAFDKVQGSAILSGDQIVPYLAKCLGASRIILAGDLEGIFTADPHVSKEARLIRIINSANFNMIEGFLSGSAVTDVTGGMKKKYIELIEAAQNGIICQIVHFKSLKDALNGESVGTVIDLSA